HYYIHRLRVNDTHQEFFQEGLVAMWHAYEKYQPDKRALSTYFNYTIRHWLIDLLQKKAKEQRGDVLNSIYLIRDKEPVPSSLLSPRCHLMRSLCDYRSRL